MTRNAAPQTPATPLPPPQVLDPRTLGRPVHLLPRFAEQFGEVLRDMFRAQNRRYRVQYGVSSIEVRPLGPASGRWLTGDTADGRIACQLERDLVLSLMAQRYGANGVDSDTGALPPETATEERLQALFSQQVLALLLPLIGNPAAPTLLPTQQLQLGPGAWSIEVAVHETTRGVESRLRIALEARHIDLLLKRLVENQPPRQDLTPKADARPLARQLMLKLEARLLEQVMPLGQLLDLRPGDVVPIRLKTTDVLVDGSRLFTASVAEHQGKLCLTSFADAD